MKKFFNRYDHKQVLTVIVGVSMADPQYKNECDIDSIMKRYKLGQPLPTTSRTGSYGDFSDFNDYQTCLEKMRRADEDFASLPSALRARFGNDARAYYQFVLDPSNVDECVRLGLRVAPVKDVPVKVTPTEVSEPSPSTSGEGNA